MNNDIREVDLPERVAVRVDELLKLREQAALLHGLMLAGVDKWTGWNCANYLCEHDKDCRDIRLGWLSVLGHRTDRGTGNAQRKSN